MNGFSRNSYDGYVKYYLICIIPNNLKKKTLYHVSLIIPYLLGGNERLISSCDLIKSYSNFDFWLLLRKPST